MREKIKINVFSLKKKKKVKSGSQSHWGVTMVTRTSVSRSLTANLMSSRLKINPATVTK